MSTRPCGHVTIAIAIAQGFIDPLCNGTLQPFSLSSASQDGGLASETEGLMGGAARLSSVPAKTRRKPPARAGRFKFKTWARCSAATVLGLVVMMGVHVLMLRVLATRKLGAVIGILQRADYYPILNEYHTENAELRRHYRR
jgi:hypothetical protein